MNLRAYRNALGQFTTGVAIVATWDGNQNVVGRTINSFVSISLDPPLIGWCLDLGSQTLTTFKNCEKFSLNFLSAEQENLAIHLAKKGNTPLEPSQYVLDESNIPHISGALTSLLCTSEDQIELGDHLMLLGRVSGFECSENTIAKPLTFFRGKFGF